MDERIYHAKIGQPIPAWDLAHRLPLLGKVGPECKDSATTFRINSTFMEASDQPNMNRHLFGMGVLLALTFTIMFAVAAVAMVFVSVSRSFSVGAISAMTVPAVGSSFFYILASDLAVASFFPIADFPFASATPTKKSMRSLGVRAVSGCEEN